MWNSPSFTIDLKEQLESLVPRYEQGTFWKKYVRKCGQFIAPKIAGKLVLEMGCSTLVVSKMLAVVARKLEIVEGARTFAQNARDHFGDAVTVYNTLFEEFTPSQRYQAIVFTNTLHHLSNPLEILLRIRDWLTPGGSLYVTVPNMRSMHRRLGVKMGLLPDLFASSDRNEIFRQPGRYTKETLIDLCTGCGYHVKECFSFFLKPFSDAQMELLNPSDEMIDALFELGQELDDLGCLLYAELSPKSRV
jgi:2-polyprenyl-3-methyl-5-hydroxy-6-metoxy-1,4-benzoquinol methylase